jgi:hypothetical protein
VAFVEEQRPPEHLDDLGARRGGEALGHVVPIVGALCPDAHFDELVLLERVIDRGDDAFGVAIFADLHDGLEVMTERAEVAALLSSEVQPVALSYLLYLL